MQQPPITQQQQQPAPAPQQEDWVDGAVQIATWIILWYLFGPAPWRGYALRKRLTQGEIWHAHRRWDEHTSVAIALPLLCWAILLYLRGPVAQIWGAIFTTLAGWIHLPVFALLGNASIFPPTLGNLLFRWLICAPLVPLIARTLEEKQPQTPYTIKRVITPEDRQVHEAIEQEEAAERQAIVSAEKEERARIKALKEARAPRTNKKPPAVQKTGPHFPPATSLWGSQNWDNVRDDDPAKRLMLEELRKLTPEQLADARREQRLAQAQSVTSTPTPASPISNPTSPPAAQGKKNSDEYDWDAGDGSVSF